MISSNLIFINQFISRSEEKSYLSLTQGDGVELVPRESFVLSKLQESHGGISPGGEDKDEGGTAVGVLVALGQVKGWGLHKLLTQLLPHKVGDGRVHLKGK